MSQSEKVTYILAEDVKSVFYNKKTNIIYGFKGTKVTEIARTDNVLIVEDGKGKRYPVNIEKLIKTN